MTESKLIVKAPLGADRALLHTCCAPCSSAIVECLLRSGIRPTVYYCNPNIYPEEEYLIRRDECARYARSLGLDIIDAGYDHGAWLAGIRGLASADGMDGIEAMPERGGRCLQCFRYRLLDSARYAARNGFHVLTTTLASSRWKSLAQIDAAGRMAVEQARSETGLAPDGLVWWEQNWRRGGLQERRSEIIREYGFYNQTWCGCEFSKH